MSQEVPLFFNIYIYINTLETFLYLKLLISQISPSSMYLTHLVNALDTEPQHFGRHINTDKTPLVKCMTHKEVIKASYT